MIFRRVLRCNLNIYIAVSLVLLFFLLIFKYHIPSPIFYRNKVVVHTMPAALTTPGSTQGVIEPSYDVRYLTDRKLAKRYLTTVVTTLFHFEKSKHADSSYEKWSDTMLASMGGPIIAYVDHYWADKFIEKCKSYNLTGIL